MFMRATVLEVNKDGLLVRDNETEQDVIVHTSCVCRIRVNDRVGIVYNGIMTNSLPPQISSSRVFRMPCHRCL